jgi:hypothetical protein
LVRIVIVVFQDLGLYSEDEADLENIDVHELAKILQVSFGSKKVRLLDRESTVKLG